MLVKVQYLYINKYINTTSFSNKSVVFTGCSQKFATAIPKFDKQPLREMDVNLLKPTGHVMHQQFNVQQLYVLPTLYLCVLYLFENKQRLVPLNSIN